MHKLASISLVGLTVVGLSMTSILEMNVYAASWHVGTPKVLRGKWKGNKKKLSGMTGRAHLLINSKSITNSPAFPPVDSEYSKKLHYKKTSKTTYKITGREYNNAPANGFKVTFKFKVYNSHKISFKEVHGRSDGNGIFTR